MGTGSRRSAEVIGGLIGRAEPDAGHLGSRARTLRFKRRRRPATARPIGIRMALGATQGHVLLRVITRTLRLTLLGIALGIIASLAVARLIASLLFGTTPTDPVTFAGMAAVLCAVALMAGFVPAHRASHIDPMIALRSN